MNVQRLPLLLLAASLTFTLNGCATQSKSDEMEAQIMQHDAQMRQMQPVQADMYNQVQSLREELNDIKGQLVDIRNAGGAAAMVDKLNRHEQALHQIETSMAMNFNLGSPLAGGNAGAAGCGRSSRCNRRYRSRRRRPGCCSRHSAPGSGSAFPGHGSGR